MTSQDLFEEIIAWEKDAGESFYDYFCHCSVKDVSWAFFLIGKGFLEHAQEIVDEIESGNTCIEMEVLYDVYPEYDEDDNWLKENYHSNIKLMAEFLTSTTQYRARVREFFDED